MWHIPTRPHRCHSPEYGLVLRSTGLLLLSHRKKSLLPKERQTGQLDLSVQADGRAVFDLAAKFERSLNQVRYFSAKSKALRGPVLTDLSVSRDWVSPSVRALLLLQTIRDQICVVGKSAPWNNIILFNIRSRYIIIRSLLNRTTGHSCPSA
jgi:hypothetical protein